MGHSSNVRKKQIKRCNKDKNYKFPLDGSMRQYVKTPNGYEICATGGLYTGTIGGWTIPPAYAKGTPMR